MILYGIPNCDTMKKARAWLADHAIAYRFHDWRKDGVDAALLDGWAERVGWEKLLNRSGTTFRGLPEIDKQDIDRAKAVALMAAVPGMIRRPVLTDGDLLEIGFKPERYAAILA